MTATPAPPKPPGRAAKAARRAAPYAAAAAAPPVLTAAMFHGPLAGVGLGIDLGALGLAAGQRALDARSTRRGGSRRAARQRRKHQSTATTLELHRTLSLHTARKRAKVTRPQTTGRIPAHEVGVHIGTHHGRPLVITHEDSVLALGGVRMGKSGWLAGAIRGAPGALLVTSTRIDLWKNTAAARAERGPVLVLNPDGYGDVPSSLRASPLDGCETGNGASTSAGYLMDAAPKDDNAAFWLQRAHTLLRLYMHAAILGGYSIDDVRTWVKDPANMDALTVLDNPPLNADGTLMLRPDGNPAVERGWADELAQVFLNEDGSEAQSSVRSTAESALAWLSDTAMNTAACAPPDQWFDAEQFIEDGGTVYLIGADRAHAPVSPYFAWFIGNLFEAAKRLAAASPGARLDPPLTLALDEAALLKAPLDRISAEAGGHGVTWIASVQSPSQLKQCWGEHGGRIVWDNATCKLIFGGLTGHEDLEAISAVCGDEPTWLRPKGPDGKKRREPGPPRRTVPPERIRLIQPFNALALYRSCRPFFPALKMVWDFPGYVKATVSPVTAPVAPPYDAAASVPSRHPDAIPGHLVPSALETVPAPRNPMEDQR